MAAGLVALAVVCAGAIPPPPEPVERTVPGASAVGIPASPPAAVALTAQRLPANPPYRDRFVFTRIRYAGSFGRFGRGGSAWSHDYPRGDRHLSRILHELTTMRVELEGTNVFDIGDPELFRYPVAYISEPGFWTMTDDQAAVLREYVLKGGFLIFDDFEGYQLDNMFAQLRRALPAARLVRLEVDHPIFQSFFAMDDIYFPHPLVRVTPVYYGVFEDNDPDKRMLAIVNHNNDIAEYWEWSDRDYLSVDYTNDAYQLGVNYMIFAMTQ